MRTILTILFAAVLAGNLGSEAQAAPKNRSKAYSKPHAYGYRAPPRVYRYGYGYRAVPPAYRYRAAPPYQERLLDAAPFGSQLWWELYNESHQPW